MDCPKRSASADLPEDSLVEVLARVPARSVYRSKCVAKAWRNLIEDPLHRKKLPQTLQGFFFIGKETHRQRVGFTNLLARSVPPQIDPSLSFLKKLPGIGTLSFLDSCNGLLLFKHKKKPRPYKLLGYVVCNPATKQWAEVPRYGPPDPEYARSPDRYSYLVFDPTVSSHFHLVQFGWEFAELVKIEEEGFMVDEDEDGDGDDEGNDDYVPDHWKHDGYVPDYWELRHQQRYNPNIYIPDYIHSDDDNDCDEENEDDGGDVSRTSVQVYSSETGKWTHMQSDWSPIQSDWDKHDLEGWRLQGSELESSCCAVLNSMLHFTILDQIVVVDVQGVTRKIITVPKMAERSHRPNPGYIAQSQGRLHYINQASDAELSIWVLENYDTQDWVLKHTVSFVELFTKKSCTVDKNHYNVVAMHPDGNVVFIVLYRNQKLISYDMDHKLVSIIRTFRNEPPDMHVVPYVPCFSESPALPNKH
ncbi:uncharacterized protein LOC123452206 [Hordeum vulgare subsp. vulgare]|uniref:Uncharacterized protein n=1 Tax=Hordeum vulgare subsp. vulgare TaxID=112509 RepID=M0VJR7_HORVV|nr:uncharacterized protein LOC123452206 [Hordeum vulgare subsp. vulgare]KAI4987227.1 hypothetical protein ZWY2020_020027 [Hordeum vulgare]